MRYFTFALFIVALASITTVVSVQYFTGDIAANTPELVPALQTAGLGRVNQARIQPQLKNHNQTSLNDYYYDSTLPDVQLQSYSLEYQELAEFEFDYGIQDRSALGVDADMIYINSFTEEPLVAQDYYWRKYENGVAGVDGINKMPILVPGDSVGLIKDKYINVKSYNGYVQPPGYYFGSGLCWSTSALGAMMDQANRDFEAKYGLPLFVFRYGDRAPHGDYYATYANANNGYGYTVLQISAGVPAQDYRFTVNPELQNIPELAHIKLKVVMLNTDQHSKAYAGQSIGGYILSNIDF